MGTLSELKMAQKELEWMEPGFLEYGWQCGMDPGYGFVDIADGLRWSRSGMENRKKLKEEPNLNVNLLWRKQIVLYNLNCNWG